MKEFLPSTIDIKFLLIWNEEIWLDKTYDIFTETGSKVICIDTIRCYNEREKDWKKKVPKLKRKEWPSKQKPKFFSLQSYRGRKQKKGEYVTSMLCL